MCWKHFRNGKIWLYCSIDSINIVLSHRPLLNLQTHKCINACTLYSDYFLISISSCTHDTLCPRANYLLLSVYSLLLCICILHLCPWLVFSSSCTLGRCGVRRSDCEKCLLQNGYLDQFQGSGVGLGLGVGELDPQWLALSGREGEWFPAQVRGWRGDSAIKRKRDLFFPLPSRLFNLFLPIISTKLHQDQCTLMYLYLLMKTKKNPTVI